jgi:hypothetical protein
MLRLATAPARFLLGELGQGAGNAVGNFGRFVARSGLKSVSTHVEIIAELPACHAGAVTNRRPGSGASVRPTLAEPAFYWLPDVLSAQWLLPVSDPMSTRNTRQVSCRASTISDQLSLSIASPTRSCLTNSDRRTCGNRPSARPTALWFKGFDRPSRYL